MIPETLEKLVYFTMVASGNTLLKTLGLDTGPWLFSPIHVIKYAYGDSWPAIPQDILVPSHGRGFREKFCSVYVVKVV